MNTIAVSRSRCVAIVSLLVLSCLFGDLTQANERGLERSLVIDEQVKETKIAIVVGVDEYDHVDNLNYAEADAIALAEVFKAQGYRVKLLLGDKTTGERILDGIRKFAILLDGEKDSPQGSLVFTFSGHGFNNEKENFLAIPGTRLDDLEGTALSMSAITDTLKALHVRQRVLFIDACRNNPISSNRSVSDQNGTFVNDDSEEEGLAVMYSTAEGSLSWEDPSLEKRSIYTLPC